MHWPKEVNNGTMLMVEKFFTSTDAVTQKPTAVSLLMYRIVRAVVPNNEQSLLRFSINQVMEFVQGCAHLLQLHEKNSPPKYLADIFAEMQEILDGELLNKLVETPLSASYKELLTLSYYTRRNAKHSITKLSKLFEKVDALRAMALAGIEHGWQFPQLLPAQDTTLSLQEFFHPLLKNPTSYSVHFDASTNFMFLTGANMSGKSTLIRSIGICAWLAHVGMPIPASSARISFLQSIITNMQIEDNIYQGESYFFAEVQRIKNTAMRMQQAKHNLVLMDELFKGTNVHDAYECTEAVMEGLLQSKTDIMALSTHLYEVADTFRTVPNIQFTYCETEIAQDGQFTFTYRLKSGVSNDRIGYLVLKREGVLDILQATNKNQ